MFLISQRTAALARWVCVSDREKLSHNKIHTCTSGIYKKAPLALNFIDLIKITLYKLKVSKNRLVQLYLRRENQNDECTTNTSGLGGFWDCHC